jgi:hypothetical protein
MRQGLLITTGAVIAAAAVYAPTARADETSFIADLGQDAGLRPDVAAGLVDVGHDYCVTLAAKPTVDEVDSLANWSALAGLSKRQAEAVVVVSVKDLCPDLQPVVAAWTAHQDAPVGPLYTI